MHNRERFIKNIKDSEALKRELEEKRILHDNWINDGKHRLSEEEYYKIVELINKSEYTIAHYKKRLAKLEGEEALKDWLC